MTVDFHDIAAEQGWTPETQVSILLDYIENQNSPEAFEDFLETKREKVTFHELFVTETIGMKIMNPEMCRKYPCHYIDCEQPATCPMCGARTDFEELGESEEDGPMQRHVCLNKDCRYTFIGFFDPEQIKELETQNDEEEEDQAGATEESAT